MSMRFFAMAGGLLAVMAFSCGDHAQAQWYLGGEAGWSNLTDQTDNVSGAPAIHKSFDSGYALGVRGGYQLGPWRFEEEYIYHNNSLDSLSVGGVNIPGASGSRDSHAIMTNVLYDFNLGWPVTPHIGAGIGAVDVLENAKAPGIGAIANDNDWVLGYQAIGGVAYNINPNLSLEVDYRYLATSDPTFHFAAAPGVNYKTSYSTHNILASLVYHFTPPPMAPPMAAPVAAPAPLPANRQVFLVFFDWDRDAITPQGQQIIEQAANAFKAGHRVQIQVTGYTDRSGSPAYNQRLSERRANNVAKTLEHDGVPRSQMAVSGRGENDNRVPTAAGVREPQNRRVEIVFP